MLAWLFPGQGSQQVGMGRALFDASPAARKVFERADAALGWKLSELCFEGPESELVLTEHAQPAIVATSMATLAALREAGLDQPRPAYTAGHSLGEYSALVAADCLSLEDAVRLVHLRGKAMQAAVPRGEGAMAAIVGADPETVERLCAQAAQSEVVTPANFNAPGQVVIAGHTGAVERAGRLATEQKFKVIPLKVSAPFHSPLMAPAAKTLEQALSGVELGALAFPVVSNVEARENSNPERVRELLVRQVDAPVRWEQSVRFMADAGVVRALELGPGTVLAGLVKRIDKRVTVRSLGSPETIATLRQELG